MLFKDKEIMGFKVKHITTVSSSLKGKTVTLGFMNSNNEGLLSNIEVYVEISEFTDKKNESTMDLDFWGKDLQEDTESLNLIKDMVKDNAEAFVDLFFESHEGLDIDLFNEVVSITIMKGKLKHSLDKVIYFYDDLDFTNIGNADPKVLSFLEKNWQRCPVSSVTISKGVYTKNIALILRENKEASAEDLIDLIKLDCMI